MTINTAIADRARAGEVLTAAELDELAAADILSLGMLADEVRRTRFGNSVTFSRVAELGAATGAEGALEATRAEMRMSALPATFDDAEALIAEARMLAGTQMLTGFSLADIVDRNWGELGKVLARLKHAGLNAIVEAPIDRLADITVFKAAHDAGLPIRALTLQKPLTTSRTDYLLAVRAIVQAVPSIEAVAPLSREQSITVPTTGYDDVRSVALARLGLPSVKNIQVDWIQYGPKLAQVALTFGANDLDRVPVQDDAALGRRRTSVEDVKRNIVAAGLTPVESVLDV